MPSTFTSNTGIELIADGEQAGAWGQTTNDNFDIIDRALNGSVSIALFGTTHTLTTSDGVLSDGQAAVLVFTGSPSGTNTVTIEPNTAQKTYFVTNSTAQTVVLSQGSGANVSVPAGLSKIVFTDGGGATAAVFDITNTLSGTFTGNLTGNVTGDVTGNADTATALQNARTFTIGNTGKTFNGTANVAWSLPEIGVGTLGQQAANNVNITGGTIDGTVIGGSTPAAISGTTGAFTSADINGGTIDGTVIGGSTAAAISGTTGAFSNDVTLPSINGGPLAGFRNAIINGNFDHNQRGVSGTVTLSAGAYGHDRWKAGGSGCTYTFATVDNVTTLTITAGSLVQVIEGASLFSGTYVLSFAGTAQGKIGSGAFSASGVTGSVTGGTNLAIEFNTGTVAQVQLEAGSVATPFERRPVGTELALCQRYFEAGNTGRFQDDSTQTGRDRRNGVQFKVTKRATPSVSLSGGDAVNVTDKKAEEILPTVFTYFYTTTNSGACQASSVFSADAEL